MNDRELQATVAAVWGWARDAASAFHGVGWDSSMAGGITYSEGFDSVLAICDAVERLTQERDAVKAGMTRRMNVMFAALREIEWADKGLYGNERCPACGGRRPNHQDILVQSHESSDAMLQPCPVAFALSEDAYAEPNQEAPATMRTFGDGSRLVRRSFWQPVPPAPPRGEEG